MPINGLSEQLRFPRLGKIRLGIKARKEDVEYPKAVDYFVCDHPAFQRVYPGKPKTLDVCFPTDDPQQWASQFYRAYTRTRGLVCKGDGGSCNRLIRADTGETAIVRADTPGKPPQKTAWVELPCQGRQCEDYQKKACREIMFLQFLLPEVEGLGIWQLDTSSINSIINVNSAVALLKATGHIAMRPIKLSVVPMEVSPGGSKKTVYVLQLDIPVRLLDFPQYSLLPVPDDEMPEELFPTEEERKAITEAEVSVPHIPPVTPIPELGPEPSSGQAEEAPPVLEWEGENHHSARILTELVDICQQLGLDNVPQAIERVAVKRYQRHWKDLTREEKEGILSDAQQKLKRTLNKQAAQEGG